MSKLCTALLGGMLLLGGCLALRLMTVKGKNLEDHPAWMTGLALSAVVYGLALILFVTPIS